MNSKQRKIKKLRAKHLKDPTYLEDRPFLERTNLDHLHELNEWFVKEERSLTRKFSSLELKIFAKGLFKSVYKLDSLKLEFENSNNANGIVSDK